jgi:hypothetical protein
MAIIGTPWASDSSAVLSPPWKIVKAASAPVLVAGRDQAVVELKREKLAAELNQRNLKNHTVWRR